MKRESSFSECKIQPDYASDYRKSMQTTSDRPINVPTGPLLRVVIHNLHDFARQTYTEYVLNVTC